MCANWIPRLQNEEADALTNSDFRHFTESRRVEVQLDKLPFAILNELFAEGEAYLSELAAWKEQEKKRKARSPVSPKGRRRKDPKLRESQPW